MYICLHVKYSLLLSYINELRIYRYFFLKIIKFHENPFSGNRVVPLGGRAERQTSRHDETNSSFSIFAHAPKNAPQCKITRTFTTLYVNLRIQLCSANRNRMKGVVNCFKPLSQNAPRTLKETMKLDISGIQVTCLNTQQFGVEKTY
jgi:hypothetical protein